MENRLSTAFWRKAASSLPAHVRERYMADFERAERWELALDAVIEFFLHRRPGASEASSSSSA